MPCIGGSNTTKKHGTLLELVLAIPTLIGYVVPPRQALNSMLRRGVYDAGMSDGVLWATADVRRSVVAKRLMEAAYV